MDIFRLAIIFSLITLNTSLKFTELPLTGVSPDRMTRTSSVIHSKNNEIITFGGRIASSGKFSSSIYSYSIKDNKWSHIIPKSGFSPPSMYNSKLFIQSSRYLIVLFGTSTNEISSSVYKFDLDLLVWTTTTLSGDLIYGLDDAASCTFEYNGVQYLGIFGGLSIEGYQNSLYL